MSRTFAEKYELLDQISSGGFGTVYRATQTNLHRLVALKILHTAAVSDKDVRSRFEREATVLSGFRHKNIVGFYGYGIERDVPYIAMEYIHGIDLQTFINTEGKLSLRKTLVIALQVAAALSVAHKAGIVHRDLKPSNIMLENGDLERVKLIDFGLARVFDSPDQQRITEDGTCIGTVEFMSPEQCLGKEVDSRSDLYSLGCVMYRCLTGLSPYQAENSVLLMHRHLYDPLPTIAAAADDSQESVLMQEILNGCLAKEPQERIQSTSILLEKLTSLHDFCTGRESQLLKEVPNTPAPNQKPRPQYLICAAAILLLIMLVAPSFMRGQPPKRVAIPQAVRDAESFLKLTPSEAHSDRLKIAALDGALESAADTYQLEGNSNPRAMAHILFLQSKLSAESGDFVRREQKLEDALAFETKNGIRDEEFTQIGETLVEHYLEQGKARAGIKCAQELIRLYESAPRPIDSTRLKEMLKRLERM